MHLKESEKFGHLFYHTLVFKNEYIIMNCDDFIFVAVLYNVSCIYLRPNIAKVILRQTSRQLQFHY